jgi:hypothetical protein
MAPNAGASEHPCLTSGGIMGVDRRRLGKDGVLAICGSQPSVLELFQRARLDKIFQFYPDIATALLHLVAETVQRWV